MSGGRCEDNRKGGMVTRAHQPCLNSASSWSRRVCVGILGAVGREGRNSHLSHYHKMSGLAQTREESVHTTQYIYEILHCHTETRVPHRETLAPNIQILNSVEIFPPPGHTGIWCSGNTLSSALCNEESCSSIPSASDSFYKNSNMLRIWIFSASASR